MLGDVDGFRGAEVELAVEVKDIDLDATNWEDHLGAFLSDIDAAPNATAVVIARSIDDDVVAALEEIGVVPLDKPTMRRTVEVWDLTKQEEAVRGFEYYLGRIQKAQSLVDDLRTFLGDNDIEIR